MEESNPCRQYLQPHSFSYGTGFPSGRCGRGTVGKYGGRPGSVRNFPGGTVPVRAGSELRCMA